MHKGGVSSHFGRVHRGLHPPSLRLAVPGVAQKTLKRKTPQRQLFCIVRKRERLERWWWGSRGLAQLAEIGECKEESICRRSRNPQF